MEGVEMGNILDVEEKVEMEEAEVETELRERDVGNGVDVERVGVEIGVGTLCGGAVPIHPLPSTCISHIATTGMHFSKTISLYVLTYLLDSPVKNAFITLSSVKL